jgi:hypothetical protein
MIIQIGGDMRCIILIISICLTTGLGYGQTADPDLQAAQVKNAIAQCARQKKAKVELVLRDLREIEGKVIWVDDDHFTIRLNEKKKFSRTITVITIGTPPLPRYSRTLSIKYSEILQLETGRIVLSFVPDPQQSPYATWDAVQGVGRGEFLQVYHKSGKKYSGVLLKSSVDRLTLMRGNTEIEFTVGDVRRVYRVSGDTSTSAAKLLSGGQKGAQISDDIFPINDPSARANPIGMAIGAGIGALIYILPGGTKRVLVFAR